MFKGNLKNIIIFFFVFLLLLFLILFFILDDKCENDFKVYPEKGYCEFNLETCEGIFGCKNYEKVQVPCGSISTLCHKKILCDCDNVNN